MASDSDSDVDELLIFAHFHTHRITLRPRRAIWIYDTIRKRRQLGEYHRLVNELREDSFRFKMYFCMSPTVFDQLLFFSTFLSLMCICHADSSISFYI